MATSNHERVGKALELLRDGLRPFVEREFEAHYQARWKEVVAGTLREARDWQARGGNAPTLDTQALLILMWDQWNAVFYSVLGHAERSLVSELRTWRNKWAHQEAFSTDDAYRALDSINRLLSAISAPEAEEVARLKEGLLRTKFEEQARQQTRTRAAQPIEGQPAGGLTPWREIVTPHEDVASGRYAQAEFAADLNQVAKGEGADEYRDPGQFYRRTFITGGIHDLLRDALLRLSGQGGDPVVELQTNFGGGKTHSMLALYHLFSGRPPAELPGIEPILHEAGLDRTPAGVRRAVLVGQALSPAAPRTKPDGTVVRTLWGELGWQLLGKEGYALVAEADRAGVSPGSDALAELLRRAAPCLVLIDEWVAYVRQLYHKRDALPAGSFEANLTFVQGLTEAARATPRSLVVASLPASDIEIGGEGGHEALDRLKNTFARTAKGWRPASAEEGFEIVRRRLFAPIDAAMYPARDAVVRRFSELYRSEKSEFPPEAGEAEYERRMRAAYPIHPELFDRLYQDWSTLDRFQRTRGVLRLMAATIHALWEENDRNLLILPASVPLAEGAVRTELVQYLEDSWVPVVEADVDGAHSIPLRLDREVANLGRFSAARRVARTIFMGSAPTLQAANKGVDERHVRLGCVQPGESVAAFGDALRRLSDVETYLYVDRGRFWYSTQPSVARTAEDRAAQLDRATVHEEIERLLRDDARQRGEFTRVHACPRSSGDVPDEEGARLVILRPEHPHTAKTAETPARTEAEAILRERGASPRRFRNTLVFLAADRSRLAELEDAVRHHLAWQSICDDRESLNLDPAQDRQAKEKRAQAEATIRQRLPEAYCWALVPGSEPNSPAVEWDEVRLPGDEAAAIRTGRKLVAEDMLVIKLGVSYLRAWLDKIPLWRGENVSINQLWEDFRTYLYLPRLRGENVLLEAIAHGTGLLLWESESFAYAEGWDESRRRYLGLLAGQADTIGMGSRGMLVKPEAALAQLERDRAEEAARHGAEPREHVSAAPGTPPSDDGRSAGAAGTMTRAETAVPILRRFHGSVRLDTLRMGRDAGQIAEEIVTLLSNQPGARVDITLEIEAELPEGAPDDVVRTVTENAATLKFSTQGFEEE